MARVLAVWALFAACSGGEGPKPTPEQAEKQAEELLTARPAVAPRSVPKGARVEVVLVWQGISSLHKGFFSDPKAVGDLGEGLADTVKGPANVYVRFDSERREGQIHLQLRPDELTLPMKIEGGHVPLQALAPITRALAAYRSAVAGRYDLRVENFEVGIESFRGPHSCVFKAGGKPPPDGRLVSPCVEVDNRVHCGRPEARDVVFPRDIARKIANCLDR